MLRARTVCAGIAALLALALAAALLPNAPTAAADSGDAITTELQPGLNLAGWTQPETPVAAIFDAIPRLTYVYAWDPDDQTYRAAFRTDFGPLGDLDTLTPGTGLVLLLSGDEPFPWTRPLDELPAVVHLREGWNLVVWAGEDRTPANDALQLLDDILEEVADGSSRKPVTLSKGDAFWLKVSASRHWDHLYEPPRIEFASPFAPEEEQARQVSVADVFAYFAGRFGVRVPGLTVRFGDDSIENCGHYAHPALVMQTDCHRAVAHEYSHAVQRHLKSFGGSYSMGFYSYEPAWLLEGVANRWSAQYYDVQGDRTYTKHLNEIVIPGSRRTTVPLRDMGTYDEISYTLAHLAIDRLASLAGDDALYDFYAQRSRHGTWEQAFHAVFGLTPREFYEGFEKYRAEVAPPLPRVEGVVLGPSDVPLADVGVRLAEAVEGGSTVYGVTDDEGRFSVWLPDAASYDLLLFADHCPLEWSSPDARLFGDSTDRGQLEVGADGLADVVLKLPALPSDLCRWIEGVVTDLSGNAREGVYVYASSVGEPVTTTTHDVTGDDGAFAVRMPSGRYQLSLRLLGVDTYYAGDRRLTAEESQATSVDITASNATGIVIAYDINGRTVVGPDVEPVLKLRPRIKTVVLGPNGVAVEGARLRLRSISKGHVWTTDRGGFDWMLESGSYELSLFAGHCPLPWSSRGSPVEMVTAHTARFELEEGAFEGLLIFASALPSEACPWIRGIVTDLKGTPRAEVPLVLNAAPRGEAGNLATYPVETGADGSFAFQVPRGRYRLSLKPLGVTAYYGAHGSLTTEAAQAAFLDTTDPSVTGIVIAYDITGRTVVGPDGEPVLTLPPRVTGVVRGPDGAPLAGVTVQMRSVSGQVWTLTTSDSGEFERTLESGRYDLLLFSGGCPLEWSNSDSRLDHATANRARLSLGADVMGLVLNVKTALSEQCGWIRGRVTDLAGNPRAGVSIYSRTWVDSHGGGLSPVPRDVTGGDGLFALRVPEGYHKVSVRLDWGVGYYERRRGFTYSRSNSPLIYVGNDDVGGIEIKYGTISGSVKGVSSEFNHLYYALREGTHTAYRPTSLNLQFFAPEGTFVLGVYCINLDVRLIGWYGGDSGLVKDRRQATPIVMDDADVSLAFGVPAGVTCR